MSYIMNKLPPINKLKDTIQDCNVNFLIGSGLSAGYLSPLGNIESLLTELDTNSDLEQDKRKIIKTSLYKHYFDQVISKNIDLLKNDSDATEVLKHYMQFLKAINTIILSRKSTILSKQINLFTTNVDVFLEQSLDNAHLEYNDGFSGRFAPQFDLSNFKKLIYKTSLHYDNRSAIPIFNLLKVHGSLTWNTQGDRIMFSPNLEVVKILNKITIPDDKVISIADDSKIEDIISASEQMILDDSLNEFAAVYEKLSIVNPTKEKFHHTLLNHTYYELLRFYSNELEKENTILFVLGFSFADEHIREITLRAANSNPTLIIYIIAHTHKARVEIEDRLKLDSLRYNNIKIIEPSQDDDSKDEFKYDFGTTNEKLFLRLVDEGISDASVQ